ncbi:Conserved_hypothetical protein [Hexamita inflata]|uniref:Uncharacterized protein n=1 Tax=Hexamita inflata TaxID=28002 RepID=A0AA86UKM3_9EUKA|nr:Conserved hypothetical protein [Hexamita inflata]
MNFDQFVEAIKTLNNTATPAETKQQAANALMAFENLQENWLVCPQLLQSEDPHIQFFGYKYLFNILTIKPQLLAPEQIMGAQQLIAAKLAKEPEASFVTGKQIQLTLQMCFNDYIQLGQIFEFAISNMQVSEQICCTMLQLLTQLFAQLSSEKIMYARLTHFRLSQMQQEVSQLNIAGLNQTLTQLISMNNFQITLSALKLLQELINFQPVVEPMLYLFGLAEFCDFSNPSLVGNTQNVRILTLIMNCIRSCLQQLCVQRVSLSKSTYSLFSKCMRQFLFCLQNQDTCYSYEFLHDFVLFVRVLQQQNVFVIFYSAQLNEVGKTLQNADILVTKTIFSVEEMIKFKLQKEGAIYEHFLSQLLFASKTLVQYLKFEELQTVIIELYADLIQQDRGNMKKIFAQLFSSEYNLIIDTLVDYIQKPQEILYYVNEFNQLEKQVLDDGSQIALYKAQINLIQLIIQTNKQYIQKFQLLMDQLLRNFEPKSLMQVTYVFEAFYMVNNNYSTQTIFMLLNLMNLSLNEAHQTLIMQSIFYVVQKSPDILKNASINLQIASQCFQAIQTIQDKDLLNTAVSCVTQCIKYASTQQAHEQYVQHIFPQIFQLCGSFLDLFQIKEIYGALTQTFKDQTSLEILLQPVQQQFYQTFENLNSVTQEQLFSSDIIGILNQICGIFTAICPNLNTQIIKLFISESIIEQLMVIFRFYRTHPSPDAVFLTKQLFSLIGQNGSSELLRELLKSEHESFNAQLQTNELKPQDVFFISLLNFCPDAQIAVQLYLDLVRYQLLQTSVNIEVNQQLYALLELLLKNSAQILMQVSNRVDFLSAFVSTSINFQFQPDLFNTFYIEHRDVIISLVFRRAGTEFIQFALKTVKDGEYKCKSMGVDLVQLSARLMSNDKISQIIGVDIGIIDGVVAGNQVAIEDLQTVL